MEIKEEIKVAAKWWADQLRQSPRHDNGDAFQSGLATLLASQVGHPSEEQIARFERELAELLSVQDAFQGDSWIPSRPEWASYARCIGCDYHPDRVISDALRKAGIESFSLLLPFKTVMQINPGEVNVAYGYGAPFKTIWPG